MHLLLDEHRGGELHSLPAFFNARAQKQSAQVLFHRLRADIKMARAISLLLHPGTSRRNTCWLRGVILISLRLIIGFSSAPSVQSWGHDPPKQKQAVRQMFADQQRHLEPYSYTATCSLRAPSLTSFSRIASRLESPIGNFSQKALCLHFVFRLATLALQ